MGKCLRDKILLLLEEHARTSSHDFKGDKEIADRLGVPVGEIQRQLDILESQGHIKSANSHDGYAAQISPQGSVVAEQLEEQVGESSRQVPVSHESIGAEAARERDMSTAISVFISHSHHDVELVKHLITLLRSALNLPSQQIRATSVDGFRLPGGSNTAERLRAEVQSSKVLIGLISNASLKSAYVIFELGARWGSGNPMVPLLAHDVGPDALEGPLQGISALSCRSSGQLHQLVEEIADHLSMRLDSAAAYEKCVEEIVKLGP